MTQLSKEFYTAKETAEILKLDISRILQLCRAKRLGQSTAKFGKQWVITAKEITEYQAKGALPPGRPPDTE